MTKTELKKLLVVEKVVDQQMTIVQAAAYLNLSTRQVKRLKKSYLTEGAKGLTHKNRGRKPVHTIPESVKEQVVSLFQSKYAGSNNCHLSELLDEHDAITISPSSVRRILIAKGLKTNKSRRRPKAYQPRKRKTQAGMLWQIDASPYAWLENRGPKMNLHGIIDDATGTVVGAVFRYTETQEGYFAAMRQAIECYGLPLGLYSDRHSIFRSPIEKPSLEQELAGETLRLSAFGKAMAELKISHIKAQTPQAKGRIERLWGTLQDRLVIELRLLNICTLEEANDVLPALIAKHNAMFAKKPESSDSSYRSLDENIDLDHVFVVRRELRQLSLAQTLSYNGKIYSITNSQGLFKSKSVVEVRETLQGNVVVFHNGTAIPLKEAASPQPKPKPAAKEKADKAPHRLPAKTHPWKQGASKQSKRNISSSQFQDAVYSQHNSYAEGMW